MPKLRTPAEVSKLTAELLRIINALKVVMGMGDIKFTLSLMPEGTGMTMIEPGKIAKIFYNPYHPKFNTDNPVLNYRNLVGVIIHEMLHKLYTDPEYERKALDRNKIKFPQLFHDINNILEDFVIESLCILTFEDIDPEISDLLKKGTGIDLYKLNPVRCLEGGILTNWKLSPPVNEKDDPIDQILSAMVQFTDMGPLVPGSVLRADLKEDLSKIYYELIQAVFEDPAKRIQRSINIYRIVEKYCPKDKPSKKDGTQGSNKDAKGSLSKDDIEKLMKDPRMKSKMKILKKIQKSMSKGSSESDDSSEEGKASSAKKGKDSESGKTDSKPSGSDSKDMASSDDGVDGSSEKDEPKSTDGADKKGSAGKDDKSGDSEKEDASDKSDSEKGADSDKADTSESKGEGTDSKDESKSGKDDSCSDGEGDKAPEEEGSSGSEDGTDSDGNPDEGDPELEGSETEGDDGDFDSDEDSSAEEGSESEGDDEPEDDKDGDMELPDDEEGDDSEGKAEDADLDDESSDESSEKVPEPDEDSEGDIDDDEDPFVCTDQDMKTIKDTEETITRETIPVEDAIEDEPVDFSKCTNAERMTIDRDTPPAYKGKIECHNFVVTGVSESTIREYNRVIEENRVFVSRFTNRLKKLSHEEEKREESMSGKFNLTRYANKRNTTLRIFDKVTQKDRTNARVVIALDVSGSMSWGKKIVKAKVALACIVEGLVKAGIPVKVMTFHDEDRFVVHHHYVNYKASKAARSSIMMIKAGGNNFDGYSIRYALKELMRQKSRNHLLIVISDGEPATNMCTNPLQDAINAIVEVKRRTKVIGIGIDANKDVLKGMYKDTFVELDNIENMMSTLGRIFVKEVRSWT